MNKERILAWQKQWLTENAEIIKACLDTKCEEINWNRREYLEQNKTCISGYRRKYREKYREWIKEKWRQYYAKNKERINQRLHDKTQTEIGRDGTCDQQGSGKVQVDPSLVSSNHVITLYEIMT